MRNVIAALSVAAFVLAALVPATYATPWLELETTPRLPEHIQNPGGTLNASCWLHAGDPASTTMRVSILDPEENLLDVQEYHDVAYQAISWNVPAGLPDGVYHVQVDYISGHETAATSRAGFLVAGFTTGLCSYKFIDVDANGAYDPDIDVLATGWEICISPPAGVPGVPCQVTGTDFVVCWFFLPVGTYTVCETQQAGYTPTTPPCLTIPVGPGMIEKAEFGNMVNPPTGACCFPDGSCAVATEIACVAAGGIYQGNDTDCDPNPCPQLGACCFPDGTCTITSLALCVSAGGIYQGDHTDCDPNPCPQVGACCFHPSGECQMLTQEACELAGGTYFGNGVPCTPGLCSATAVDRSTWGGVKHIYR